MADDETPTPTSAPPRRLRRLGIFALAFGSGFAVLTIELAGARLIAPVFGMSTVPWTAVIGVILAALAVGSHFGGRLADGGRVPLAAVLAAAGVAGVIPVVGVDLPWAAQASLGYVGGALLSAVVLFAPAVLCLGAVVPYLVRADTRSLDKVGRRAGDVSAAATAGSIAGTFATGFWLLPAFSLPVLLGVMAGFLLVLALLSGWILGGRVPPEVLALAAVATGALAASASRLPDGTLAQEQTRYASVQVTQRRWDDGRMVRELIQNGGSSSAEYVDTDLPAHPYVAFSEKLLSPVLAGAGRVLVLGGAALSLPVAMERERPDLPVDVVEIDPAVTDLARRYFAYGKRPYPNIDVIEDDARVYARTAEARYDLVFLDVFDNFLTVPWTMVTEEAFREMAARLDEHGVFAANLLSPMAGPQAELLRRIRATAERVFGEVRLYPVDATEDPGAVQNVILVAVRNPADMPATGLPRDTVSPAGPPFTDMYAPVNYLQAKLFLEGFRWQ